MKILNLVPNAKDVFENLKRMPKEQIVASSNSLIQYLLSNLDVELKNTTEQVQQKTKFACFLQKIYSGYDVGGNTVVMLLDLLRV